MSIKIPERYVEMNHPVLEDTCPVCKRKFEVGDSVEMVAIQKSRTGREFDSEAMVVHTECHYVE